MISQVRFFYGALLTLSLFNTILLLWLGLTVLLNVGRRTWGAWLAGGGLVAGGLFFISHIAVLAQSAVAGRPQISAWWPLGWVALILAPFTWYVAMLWHTGYWQDRTSALHREHRPLLTLATLFAIALLALITVARPLPSALQLMGLYFAATPAIMGIPALVLLYPLFMTLCLAASLFALTRPGPTGHAMQEPARRRARPWLMAASGALLSVDFLMVSLLVWLVLYGGADAIALILAQPMFEAFWLDLTVSLPITAAVALVGQALVAYEIFTGKTLPRRGLRRQWHNTLVLAGGFSLAVGAGFALELPPVYAVLLATVFLALAFALFSWRSYLEREQYINQLRPFAASEHLFDTVLRADAPGLSEAAAPLFTGLCRDVLGASSAYLFAAGSLASLVQAPLVHPPEAVPACDLNEMLARCSSPGVMSVALEPARHGGAIWAVPLWSGRGLIGAFCLGEKRDGGLYSEEEIEIARASGERLLDTMAGATLASRLMALQRQRFVETQVLDQQSRRALHDEVLPGLHAVMLGLRAQSDRPAAQDLLAQLADIHKRVSALILEMPSGLGSQVAKLGLLGALRRMVESEFLREFDEVTWQIEPEAEAQSQAIPPLTGDVVFYGAKEAIRNSARHGRGPGRSRPLRLSIAAAWREGLEITIADDGVGLAAAPRSGPAGGQGLALHSTMMAVIGGWLGTSSRPAGGTTVTLFLPQQSWSERTSAQP